MNQNKAKTKKQAKNNTTKKEEKKPNSVIGNYMKDLITNNIEDEQEYLDLDDSIEMELPEE